MDIETALYSIIEKKEFNEARKILLADKGGTSALVKKMIDDLLDDTVREKRYNRDYINSLLYLVCEFDVKALELLVKLLQEKTVFEDSGGNDFAFSELYGRALANSISNCEDLAYLDKYFFSEDVPKWGRYAIFIAVRGYLLSKFIDDDCDNKYSKAVTNRYNDLVEFYHKVIDATRKFLDLTRNNNSNLNDPYSSNSIIYITSYIISDSIEHDFYHSLKLKEDLLLIVEEVIAFSGMCRNTNSILRKYFDFLKLISPDNYCKAKNVEESIRFIWNSIYEIDAVFTACSLKEVGETIYETIKTNLKVEDIIAKIGIQLIHEYPYNQRSVPRLDEEYYFELCEYLEIGKAPLELYSFARKEYENVRIAYEKLITKINALELKCNELVIQSENVSTNIISKKIKRILQEDISDAKRQLIVEMQKRKELTALYKTDICNGNLHERECNPDSYLEYCKSTLEKMFDFFIPENCSENEINVILKKWVLSDVRMTDKTNLYASSFSAVEENFNRYRSVIEQVDKIIDDDPWITLRIQRYRAKSIVFMNEIFNEHRHQSGAKLFDCESDEYKAYQNDVKKHPLYPSNLLLLKNGRDYLDRLNVVAQDAINLLKNHINDSLCLRKRKKLLETIITLFDSHDYETVINLIPIQIEGLLADYLDNSLLFYFEYDNKGMKTYEQIYNSTFINKINKIVPNNLNIGFETIGYFKYYFNSVYRNTIAHGNYRILFCNDTGFNNLNDKDVIEIIAHELLLDLNYIVDSVAKSNELDEAKRYLQYTSEMINGDVATGSDGKFEEISQKGVDHECEELKNLDKLNAADVKENLSYDKLFCDLIGKSHFNSGEYKQGIFVSYDPVQILFWIFNPLFEDAVGKDVVNPIRDVLLSENFWNYVNLKIDSRLIYKDNSDIKRAISKFMALLVGKDSIKNLATEVYKKLT